MQFQSPAPHVSEAKRPKRRILFNETATVQPLRTYSLTWDNVYRKHQSREWASEFQVMALAFGVESRTPLLQLQVNIISLALLKHNVTFLIDYKLAHNLMICPIFHRKPKQLKHVTSTMHHSYCLTRIGNNYAPEWKLSCKEF